LLAQFLQQSAVLLLEVTSTNHLHQESIPATTNATLTVKDMTATVMITVVTTTKDMTAKDSIVKVMTSMVGTATAAIVMVGIRMAVIRMEKIIKVLALITVTVKVTIVVVTAVKDIAELVMTDTVMIAIARTDMEINEVNTHKIATTMTVKDMTAMVVIVVVTTEWVSTAKDSTVKVLTVKDMTATAAIVMVMIRIIVTRMDLIVMVMILMIVTVKVTIVLVTTVKDIAELVMTDTVMIPIARTDTDINEVNTTTHLVPAIMVLALTLVLSICKQMDPVKILSNSVKNSLLTQFCSINRINKSISRIEKLIECTFFSLIF